MSQPAQAGGGSKGRKSGLRLADQAYLKIRDLIVTVAVPPGAPLDEATLVEELGIGLTPIREALKRLTLERLAVIYPRRGTFASDINISDEQRLTEVRMELEGLAAALAAERASEEELLNLKNLLRELEVSSGDPVKVITVDSEIHRAIYAATRNPFLESTLNQYANLALRIWYYCLNRLPARTSHSCDQHAVVAAICDRDRDAARKAAQDHLRLFSDEVRALLS